MALVAYCGEVLRRWLLPWLAMALLTTGCATYSSRVADLRPQLANGQFDAALQTLADGTGGKDRLLYLLERGLVLHYADRYTESNEAFDLAEQLADDLYTKSVSQGALSLITSDESISYRARPFEMAMVPYFRALNYLYLQQPQGAVVEARRAGLLQAKYVEATLAGLREQDRGEFSKLRADPFLLYFSGMLYEQVGEVNDAFIAYRNAAAAYEDLHEMLHVEVPRSLADDLTRTAHQLGFQAELEEVAQSCPTAFAGDQIAPTGLTQSSSDTGRVVVLLETGYVPRKTQVRFDFPVFSGQAYDDPDYWSWEIYAGMGNFHAMTSGHKVEYWVSVAAPELQDSVADPVASCRISSRGMTRSVPGLVVANVAREARLTFDAEKPAIFAKTILRGLTKYLASRQAGKSIGKVGGWLTNLLGSATEKADTRSWLTLPDRIMMGRLDLPAGHHTLQIDLLDGRGKVLGTTTGDVLVKAGGWTFISRRVF